MYLLLTKEYRMSLYHKLLPTLCSREYNEWIMVKLQQMSELVSQADQLTKREIRFIESYPLSTLMKTEAVSLLKEAKVLMESLVSCNIHT